MRAEYKLRLQFSFYFLFKTFFCLQNIYKVVVKNASKIILHLFVPRKRRYEVEENSILNYFLIVTVMTYMYRLHQTPETLPSAHILY